MACNSCHRSDYMLTDPPLPMVDAYQVEVLHKISIHGQVEDGRLGNLAVNIRILYSQPAIDS